MIIETSVDLEGDGEWGDILSWPIIPLHSIVLPDGNVLSFGTTEQGMQGGQFVYDLWDPVTNVHRTLENTTETNIFCSNMALDPVTGNVIIMGGDANGLPGGSPLAGIEDVVVFDYETQTIRDADVGDMEFARWYGTELTLPNGELLILAGRDENYDGATFPEIYNAETGFRTLTGAEIPDFQGEGENLDGTWWYPHAFVDSAGDVIIIEAHGSDIYRMTTDGDGSVEKIGELPFEAYKLNSSVMFAPDKIMILADDGGLWVGDLSGDDPVFTREAELVSARTNAGLSILPDGRVAITGGGSPINQGNQLEDAVYHVTIWDPETNDLTVQADEALARLYHSSALILPDGTVFSGGGGAPGPQTNLNAQVFMPAYLYDENGELAERPEIVSAPTNILAGDTFQITVSDANAIEIVSATRSGAMTHGRNSDARFVKLDFTVIDAQTIEISTPDANIMGPGLWMLTTVDEDGVPSVSSLMGVNFAPLVDTPDLVASTPVYNIDDEQIDGPFELTVEARFDDLDAGQWQRVFDFGNGTEQDNIWLGQVLDGTDMRFEIWRDGVAHTITATDAIVEGEIATWKVIVDDQGMMSLFKNGELLVDGQGVVPADVERTQNFVGASNWPADAYLRGMVRNLDIVQEDDGTEPVSYAIDGAFTVTAEVRFDDLDVGPWQRVFDFGNGPNQDNIWLGQAFGTNDMRFEIIYEGVDYYILAPGAIVEGETATWTASIDEAGWMRLYKDGTLLAQGQGVVPPDVERTSNKIGDSNWDVDTPLQGEVVSIELQAGHQAPVDDGGPGGGAQDDEYAINGAFTVTTEVRFDDLSVGPWQRVFDFGNGPNQDNVWLGQAWGTNDMRFEVIYQGLDYFILAPGAIVEGETAVWTANIDETGLMRLYKDGELLAEGQGVVPPDVVRTSNKIGDSNWAVDTPLQGEVISLVVEDGAHEPGSGGGDGGGDGGGNGVIEIADTPDNQTINGTDAVEAFVIDGPAADYRYVATDDGTGVVVWKGASFDLLYGVEELRFSDKTIDLTALLAKEPASLVDDAGEIEFVTGSDEEDVFVISGNSADYGIRAIKDGESVAVWSKVEPGVFDLLKGIEKVQFDDQTVDISGLTSADHRVEDDASVAQDLHGGGGEDTFVVNGDAADYAWSPVPGGQGHAIWNTSDPELFDVLTDFEKVEFNDQTVDLV